LVIGDGKHTQIRVSSTLLISNSPVFKVLLTGHFKEASDFQESTSKYDLRKAPHELRLIEDDFKSLLLLSLVIYHKAPPPPSWLNEKPYEDDVVLTRICDELKRFRQFAVLIDKYQCVPACTHLVTNWLNAILLWTDFFSDKKELSEKHLMIRFAIAEIALLLGDEFIFSKVTSLLLYNSCNVRGLDDWSDYIGFTHPILPDSFYTIYFQRRQKYWTQLHTDISFIRDFLSLGGTQPCAHDIKQTTVHGYYFHRYASPLWVSFTSKSIHDTDSWGTIQDHYRLGTHDLMLLGGFSAAVNKVTMNTVMARQHMPLSAVVEKLKKVKIQPFATIRSLEPKPYWKWCRACEFNTQNCLAGMLDKFENKVHGLCLKCVMKGIDDCLVHEDKVNVC
jgi:hypothetical protein